MRKKLVVLIIVALIALVAVVPALAAGNGNGGSGNGNGNGGSGHGHGGPGGKDQQSFTIGGYITAIGNDTITVRTVNYRSATVQVTNSTSFFRWTSDGRVPITFDDVEKGDSINIKGTVDGDVFTADVVTVDVECQN